MKFFPAFSVIICFLISLDLLPYLLPSPPTHRTKLTRCGIRLEVFYEALSMFYILRKIQIRYIRIYVYNTGRPTATGKAFIYLLLLSLDLYLPAAPVK